MSDLALIGSPAVSDAGSISGAATSGDLTVANLLTAQPTETCRFASLDSMFVVLDLLTAQAIIYIWFGYGNADADTTVRVRAATSEANLTASPGYDSGTEDFWPTSGLEDWSRTHAYKDLRATPQTYRWWRFDFASPANAAGYFELGRLILFTDASLWEPARSVRVTKVGPVEEPLRIVAQGGPTYPVEGARPNLITLSIPLEDRDNLLARALKLSRLRGTSREILVILTPLDPAALMEFTVYGLLESSMQIADDDLPYWGTIVEVREMV